MYTYSLSVLIARTSHQAPSFHPLNNNKNSGRSLLIYNSVLWLVCCCRSIKPKHAQYTYIQHVAVNIYIGLIRIVAHLKSRMLFLSVHKRASQTFVVRDDKHYRFACGPGSFSLAAQAYANVVFHLKRRECEIKKHTERADIRPLASRPAPSRDAKHTSASVLGACHHRQTPPPNTHVSRALVLVMCVFVSRTIS